MKDIVKEFVSLDRKHIALRKHKISFHQKQQNYPKSFEFPITLQLEVTRRCNLRCVHCYNESGVDNGQTDLTTKKWLSIAHSIVENGGIFQCIISGGEPLLLGEGLLKIMDIFHEDGTAFLLITNGYFLDNSWIKKLAKYRFYWIQISIDGVTARRHDSFRGVVGSWEKAISAALLLSENGLPLVIAHSVIPENLGEVGKMTDLAYQLGASSIILGDVTPSGRAFKNTGLFLSREQKSKFFQQIVDLQKKYMGRMDVQRAMTTRLQLEQYELLPNSGAIIRPNGDVRLDCMAPFVIGNVREKTIGQIWREKAAACWKHPSVKKYIQSIDEISQESDFLWNYCQDDIRI